MSIGRKRIAILADFPWNYFTEGAVGRGGGQSATWLGQLAEEFSKFSEYEFHWVTLDRSGAISQMEFHSWNGQTFYRIPTLKLSLDLLIGYRWSRKRLEAALARIDPALVHCWGSERAYAIVCADSKVPTIFSLQGILHHLRSLNLLPAIWQWRAIARWEPRYLSTATVVTCESNWGIELVKKSFSDVDLRQVEYGVHPSFFAVEWQPDQQEPYALFVGTLNRGKGIDALVESMSLLPDRGWKLRVAGEGPLRDELEARNIAGVEWLGTIRWEELKAQLSGATCLVLPTLADTSPNVVKEARVVGLPVVTSRHGGQTDYVRDGENGILIDPRNPREIADALSRLMLDPELALQMGARHQAENREYLRPSRTANDFTKIYRELID